MKSEIISAIRQARIVAILRGVPEQKLPRLLEALYQGGIRLAEITFDAKAICAPLSHIDFIAVGGVDHQNVADFLRAGAVGVGVGSNIVNKKMLAEDDYAGITALARRYMEAIEKA